MEDEEEVYSQSELLARRAGKCRAGVEGGHSLLATALKRLSHLQLLLTYAQVSPRQTNANASNAPTYQN